MAAHDRRSVLRRHGAVPINDLASHIRPTRAIRRNAYQRMFSMDLNHGGDDGKPYPYVRAEAANTEFVSTLEECCARCGSA